MINNCVRLDSNDYTASRLVKNILHNTNEDIKHYQDRLATLIARFNDLNAVDANIVAIRILKTADNLSKSPQPIKYSLH
jgi:hypothetical protein